jgi:hypothetical protein
LGRGLIDSLVTCSCDSISLGQMKIQQLSAIWLSLEQWAHSRWTRYPDLWSVSVITLTGRPVDGEFRVMERGRVSSLPTATKASASLTLCIHGRPHWYSQLLHSLPRYWLSKGDLLEWWSPHESSKTQSFSIDWAWSHSQQCQQCYYCCETIAGLKQKYL